MQRLEGAADPKTEGKKICIELLQQLAETPGVAGAHVMAPAFHSAIGPVNKVKPPETRQVKAPWARMVATKARPPAVGRMRSAIT